MSCNLCLSYKFVFHVTLVINQVRPPLQCELATTKYHTDPHPEQKVLHILLVIK